MDRILTIRNGSDEIVAVITYKVGETPHRDSMEKIFLPTATASECAAIARIFAADVQSFYNGMAGDMKIRNHHADTRIHFLMLAQPLVSEGFRVEYNDEALAAKERALSVLSGEYHG